VDTGKEIVVGRMRQSVEGPGYMHLPNADWVDDEYLAQLTSEKPVRKYDRRRGAMRVWEKVRERNEALDLEVYALAALYILGRKFIAGLGARAKEWAETTTAAPAAVPAPRTRGGWVGPWSGI